MNARMRSAVLCVVPFLCAVPAFAQRASLWASPLDEESLRPVLEKQRFATPTPEYFIPLVPIPQATNPSQDFGSHPTAPPATVANQPGESSKIEPVVQRTRNPPPDDFNHDIFYRNKLEYSLEVGWLPNNIPFPFDFMLSDGYDTYPLKYTLVPVIASLRWQVNNIGAPWIFRGNWDVTFSGAVTLIPRGPETRYFAYIMGFRRNFVQRNWRLVPYWDGRLGLGNIDAKGPLGVMYAQGQDFTFTLGMGSGVRYTLNSRYAISAGLSWMHISNANLSEGSPPNWGIRNYGINVYGPMVGIDILLHGHRHRPDQ
jgi:lipid A 3-O-deacylase PagL